MADYGVPPAARFAMIRNLGLLSFAQVLAKAIVFLALATLARRLSRHDYGAVEYALGMSSFAALVIDGGLGAVGVRRLNQQAAPVAQLAAQIPAAQTCLALLVAAGLFALAWLTEHDHTTLMLIAMIALSVLLLPFKQDWLFQAQGRMTHIAVNQIIRVATFAALAVFIALRGAPTWLVGLAEVISVACATAYLIAMQSWLITPMRVSIDRVGLIGLAREGLPIGAGALCWAATQFVPLFVLAPLAGLEPTAYFGAAHRLGVSLVTFSWIYHFNLFPVLAQRIKADDSATESLLSLSMRLTGWGGIGLALVLTLAAPALLPLLFGPAFAPAALPFAILIWSFPLTLLSGHARWLLVAAERPGDMLMSQAFGVVVALLASALLVPRFAASGAAAAMVLACAAVWASSQYLAARAGRPVPISPCLPPVAAALAVLAAAHFAGAGPWLAALLGGSLFAAAGLLLDSHFLADLRWIIGWRQDAPSKA